jgi:hypothetical protein
MHETMRAFCKRYGVHCGGDPQVLPHSQKSWLFVDRSGGRWVVKPNQPEDKSAEMLRSFRILHPPFRHPQPLSSPDDPYLLYAYLPGQVLARGPFDDPEVIERVFEAIGRFRAMMRSLNLVPFLEEKLKKSPLAQGGELSNADGKWNHRQRTDPSKLMPTRLQIAGSFHWARRQAESSCELISSLGWWAQAPLAAFRDHLDRHLSIHIPVVGNNLSHTAMHPEHIVLGEDGGLGVVGWHIEPRPRFYMNHTYLAWALLRSETPFILAHCRDTLSRERTRDFYKDHQLVFALCLIEQLSELVRPTSLHEVSRFHAGIALAEALFCECVEILAREGAPK